MSSCIWNTRWVGEPKARQCLRGLQNTTRAPSIVSVLHQGQSIYECVQWAWKAFNIHVAFGLVEGRGAMHYTDTNKWIFNATYVFKLVVHGQSPPTIVLILGKHVLPADSKSSNLRITYNFKHLSIPDLFLGIVCDKVYIQSITYILKSLFREL